jgi:hypothetical protein
MPAQHTIGPRGLNHDLFRYFRVQGQYVHVDRLGKLISKYNRPIVIQTERKDFPFYFRGSACLLRLQNRCFAVTCLHNLNDGNSPFEGIFLQARLGGGMKSNIPLSGVSTPKKECRNTLDCFDIAIFEADLDELSSEGLDREFFDISRASDRHVPTSNEPILACGFPYRKGAADYKKQAISRPATIVDGRFEKWSSEPHVYCCKIQKSPAGGVSDGFSGGGAFGVRPGPASIDVCFSGIVVRGGDNFFYTISSDFIRESLYSLTKNS